MADEQPNIDYIYDFIYLDAPRLTSYLAQLNDDGVLISIKQGRHITEEQKQHAGVGINNATKTGAESKETLGKQAERHYDSSQTALYSVIDRLDELGLVKKNIAATGIGQILLCSGTITFQDIRMMRDLWDPVMKLTIDQEARSTTNKQQKRLLIKQKSKEFDTIKTVLTALPHALLMSISSGGRQLWSSLDEAHLKINSDDITLKHGANFAGKWYVLGIMDAKPDNETPSSPPLIGNELFEAMSEMLNAIRILLGRPANAYGMTPIAIFRTLAK